MTSRILIIFGPDFAIVGPKLQTCRNEILCINPDHGTHEPVGPRIWLSVKFSCSIEIRTGDKFKVESDKTHPVSLGHAGVA